MASGWPPPLLLVVWALLAGAAEALRPGRALSPPRVAVFVAGTPDRMLIAPLVENVISPYAARGYKLDLFMSLAPSPPLDGNSTRRAFHHPERHAGRFVVDPRVAGLRETRRGFESGLLKACCGLAAAAGATTCRGGVEPDGLEPLERVNDSAHRRMIIEYSPLRTLAGVSLLRKWRSLASMWQEAKALEGSEGFRYAEIINVRDDSYWIAPHSPSVADFVEDPKMIKVIPCMDFHGINDKVVHMGRDAADVMMGAYEAWMQGSDAILANTRNAEEFWYRMAVSHGLSIQPQTTPQALASFTDVGLPCFRKQKSHTWLREQFGEEALGLGACFGDGDANGAMAELFYAFNCDDLNPVFYSQISALSAGILHSAIKQLARQDRSPVIVTFVDSEAGPLVQNLLFSLRAAGERSGVLVVGVAPGACRSVDADGLPDVACVVVPPVAQTDDDDERLVEALDSETVDARGSAIHRHAVLTTVVASGLTQGVLYCEPSVVFLRPPVAAFRERLGAGRIQAVFAPDGALPDGQSARQDAPGGSAADAGGERDLEIDTGLFYVADSAGSTDLLLRAWMLLAESAGEGRAAVHRWALLEAIRAAPWVKVASVPREEFANGNAFWGHRGALQTDRLRAVHVNWMDPQLRLECMARARLLAPAPGTAANAGGLWWRDAGDTASLDDGDSLRVSSCSDGNASDPNSTYA